MPRVIRYQHPGAVYHLIARGDETASWEFQSGLEPAAVEAKSCIPRPIQIHPNQGGGDASRVRNRNAILVLGVLRRSAVGIFCHWRRHRKNLWQSTFKDGHDAMNPFNYRLAFATITARRN